MQKQREILAGGKEGASKQQAAELKALATDDRNKLLVEAGVKPPPGKVSAASRHALTADLKLPWFQQRKLQRRLKQFGVQIQSERVMREQISADLPFELVCYNVPLSVSKSSKEQTIEERPVVCFTDLPGLVHHYISQHDKAQQLTWHGGAIPATDIFVKLGDHGGGSFKMSFQLSNATNPNSVKNTVVFLAFGAKNTYDNLAQMLKPYAEQISFFFFSFLFTHHLH